MPGCERRGASVEGPPTEITTTTTTKVDLVEFPGYNDLPTASTSSTDHGGYPPPASPSARGKSSLDRVHEGILPRSINANPTLGTNSNTNTLLSQPLFRFNKAVFPSSINKDDKDSSIDGKRSRYISPYRSRIIPSLALGGRNRERLSSTISSSRTVNHGNPHQQPHSTAIDLSHPDRQTAGLSQTLTPRKALELRGEIPLEPIPLGRPLKKHSPAQSQIPQAQTGRDRSHGAVGKGRETVGVDTDVEPARTGAALPVIQQPYIPDPPMTFADRRRAESGPIAGTSTNEGSRARVSPSKQRGPWNWKRSVDGEDRAGLGSISKGKASDSAMQGSPTALTPTSRRRVEIEETDAERKKREMESVINWKVWAAACVASNAIPIEHDFLRSTPQPTPRSRSRVRPRLAVHTNSSRPMFDSSSTVSSEDHIISPVTDEGTGWTASGAVIRATRGPIAALAGGQKRPLSHSTSMGELQAIKESHRNQSLPDMIAIDGERDALNGPRKPTNRKTAGRSTPMSQSTDASRTSSYGPSSGGISTPTPVAGLTNALLGLRPRLTNKNVREIALELVHALSAYTELMDGLDTSERAKRDGKNKAPSRTSWSRSALDDAREKGLLNPATTQEAQFQGGEVIALFRDLDETIGYPGYVEKMLVKAGYGIHDTVFRRENDGDPSANNDAKRLDSEQCEKMLLDLEDLLWGRSEPLPDDIAYGHLVLPTGKIDRRMSDQGPEPISSSLFDILAEPVPDTLTDMNIHDFAKPFGATMRKPSLFADGPTSRHGSVVYIPGVSTIDIAAFVMPSSGRNSVDPHEAGAGRPARRESTVRVKSPEDLAREGRERYEAWQKSREMQPLKRS